MKSCISDVASPAAYVTAGKERFVESYRFYYQIKKDGSICLLRCFGETGAVVVPAEIRGLPVTEIGTYCFAENGHLDGKVYETEEYGEPARLAEQCGRFLTSAWLPDTVRQVDGYAFYNCRKLASLSVAATLTEIGNDTFMNCTNLHTLDLRGSVREKSALQQLLAQITWQVEVFFLTEEGKPQAALYFPEYSEYYDLIGPAHIFELLVQGEGFRARHCFAEGIFKLNEYDGIFDQACVDESETTLCRFALDRLQYPVDLRPDARDTYHRYLKDHVLAAAKDLLFSETRNSEEQMEAIRQMAEEKILDAASMDALIAWSVEREKAEVTAALMKEKRKYFSVSKKKRYEF